MSLSKKEGQMKGALPSMSIISSGSAAIAIQAQLKNYKLPPLKVLVDFNMHPKIISAMEQIGCEIHETDLSRKPLNKNEILALTSN